MDRIFPVQIKRIEYGVGGVIVCNSSNCPIDRDVMSNESIGNVDFVDSTNNEVPFPTTWYSIFFETPAICTCATDEVIKKKEMFSLIVIICLLHLFLHKSPIKGIL